MTVNSATSSFKRPITAAYEADFWLIDEERRGVKSVPVKSIAAVESKGEQATPSPVESASVVPYPQGLETPLLFRYLEGLDLKSYKLQIVELRIILRSRYAPGLKFLNLSGCNIGEEGVLEIGTSPQLDQLQVLNLNKSGVGAFGAGVIAVSPYLKEVRTLKLGGNDIGVSGVKVLVRSLTLTRLENLNLKNNNIRDYGVQLLADAPTLGSLRSLNIGSNFIRVLGAQAIASSRYLTYLQSLKLGSNQIGSYGTYVIVISPVSAKLKVLDLSNTINEPTENLVIAALTTLTHLGTLNLSGCRIGLRKVQLIQKGLPQLQKIIG
jgi:Leucine-rich repeat (LRR) protein